MSDINPIISILSGMKRDMKKMADSLALMQKTHGQRLTEEYVNIVEASAIMKVSERTIQNLKSSGQLPYTKINGLLYFNTTDIENLFKDNYVSSSTSTSNDSPFNSKSNVSTSK